MIEMNMESIGALAVFGCLAGLLMVCKLAIVSWIALCFTLPAASSSLEGVLCDCEQDAASFSNNIKKIIFFT
jgi:hypothetical protein